MNLEWLEVGPVKQPRKFLLALSSLLIIVSTLGVGLQHLTKPPSPTGTIRYMIVDWFVVYESVEAMARAPEVDVIVCGAIKDVEFEGLGLNVESKYLFKPHWVVKGLSTFRSIWVHQTGGITPMGETYVAYGNPLMQVGNDLILFLHEFERATGEYYAVGGPQGRFVVQGGRVYSIGEVYKSPDEGDQRNAIMLTRRLHTGGTREIEFFWRLHAALSEP